MRVNLLDFLKTGHFGDVELGMSRKEVLHILGEPTHLWDRKPASLWSYGYITLFFPPKNKQHSGLYWIHCDQLVSPLYAGDKFILEESIVTSELNLSDAEILFQKQDMAYEKCTIDIGNDEISYQISLESDVNLYFYPDNTDIYNLKIFSKRMNYN